MKTLHVMNDSIPLIGGYTIRSRSIVTHQRQIGMYPWVITSVRQGPTEKDTEEFDGIPHLRTNWPKKCFMRKIPLARLFQEEILFYRSICRAIRKISPDIIHAHSPILCAFPGLLAARKFQIPIVYEIRAFWEDAAVASNKFSSTSVQYRTIRWMETFICRSVDRVVSISRSMKNDLIARGIPESKVFVVPNGVDALKFESKPKNPELISNLGLNGKAVIGYLGTFYDFEGIDDLIRAFAAIYEREKNVALLIVGGGEMENAIRNQIAKPGGAGVIFVGKVPPDAVPEYYALMDMVVYPRKRTRITEMTTPLKPLEAMALGKPVICSAVGGLKEMVGLDNGLFYEPGNDRELVRCCKRVIHDPALAARLAAAGKKRALSERNWCCIVEEYPPIYDGIRRRPGSGNDKV
ncbi:MAG TPA: glycosyltransferase [Deltaproteobacteria bacterium]|nr:glycosyltransferase [Deltaproteobacteria bacterium]